MRDIPMFTTESGAASLVLKEIPHKATAYVRVHCSETPEELIAECVSFCRAAGAEQIFATGHEILKKFPFHTSILEMRTLVTDLPDTDACIFPVQEKTLSKWREIYNNRMQNVANAAYMTSEDAEKMLCRGDGYFIHREGELLGIGIAAGNRIDLIASFVSGTGKDIVAALAHALSSDEVLVEVASANERAIRLYRSLGFITVRELSNWYKIL